MIQEKYRLGLHGPIYAYLPDEVSAHPGRRYPMVLDLNCTTGNPRAEVMTNGWDQVAAKENLIIIAPTYNDYAMYSETGYMKRVIDDTLQRYPVDPTRIYSVGFSNGGALSGALASTYPTLLAGIAAMGWMVGLRNTNLTIPFLLIQGTKEYTSEHPKAIMDDEKIALHDLFTADKLRTGQPDYQATPYWGYRSDEKSSQYPRYHDYDPYGNHPRLQTKKEWQVSRYYRDDFQNPLAELVLVEDAPHIPHDCNAQFAWDFLQHFKRVNGRIVEN